MFRATWTAAPTILWRAFFILMLVVPWLANWARRTLPVSNGPRVQVWLTTADQRHLLAPQPSLTFGATRSSRLPAITVDDGHTYQQLAGFGASFTDSSAWLVYDKLSVQARAGLIAKLFSPTQGIGLSFLRQPMGASDLTPPWIGEYTYDDMPPGQTDPSLSHFSVAHDAAYIIPVLQQALATNPRLKVIGTPWSPPAWMKVNDSLEGGSLSPSAYGSYAQYFVRYLLAYRANGIPIYAVTPQNEPLYTPVGYPGMLMSAGEEDTFVKDYLGPAMAQAVPGTQILIYDHNWSDMGYPQQILADPAAAPYVAGVAWHCYAGNPTVMSALQARYPAQPMYLTECAGSSQAASPWSADFRQVMELIVDATRDWAASVLRWNVASDTGYGPTLFDNPALNRGGAAETCRTCRGLVTIDQQSGQITYTADYYGLAQASAFVTPGAYRIASTSFGRGSLLDVAFLNPDRTEVLVVYNDGSAARAFTVRSGARAFSYRLPAGAAATFRWAGTRTARQTTVDDGAQGMGADRFQYVGSGWHHCTACDRAHIGMYQGSNSWDNSVGDMVKLVFRGTGIRLYGVVGPAHGIGALSIDGGRPSMVDFYAPVQAGDQLLWSSGPLAEGVHTLLLRVTGQQNPMATWNGINPDRVDIAP
ncbi:MAG TPA: glycoside hydrolase family 30 beta sandwich domain-containing protein [Chloroflexota bacterium]|nr:glycoside hydrolase family 30 beta sandwich domain-containing protein [Chloroflexota bacterium]